MIKKLMIYFVLGMAISFATAHDSSKDRDIASTFGSGDNQVIIHQ